MNLFDFTYCGDYNRQIQNLARMVPERWSFSDTADNGILKGYLEHTFKRLYEEKKVWEKENYAIFNTGLFNCYYQPIYAYFIPNSGSGQAVMVSGWILHGVLFIKGRNYQPAGEGKLCGKSFRSGI